jgi:hypothetical protein
MKKAGRKSRVRVPLKVSKIMFVGPVTDTILYRFLFYTKMLAVPNVTILHFIWYGTVYTAIVTLARGTGTRNILMPSTARSFSA